jgi:hypothetical protein
MSYMGSKDLFSGKARRDTEARLMAKDEGNAQVAYEAMGQINSADDAIRVAVDRIQKAAAEVLSQLNSGSFVYERGVASPGEDLSRAIARRQQAFQFLGLVLSTDEITAAINAG